MGPGTEALPWAQHSKLSRGSQSIGPCAGVQKLTRGSHTASWTWTWIGALFEDSIAHDKLLNATACSRTCSCMLM
jgi:hypothetical protein